MTRLLACSLLIAAFSANASFAGCPASVLKINDVTLSSDGVVTRTVLRKKESDAQRKRAQSEEWVSVVRDVLRIEKGDEIILNAGLEFQDANFYVKLKLVEKEQDEKGVFFTTYEVLETTVSTMFGTEQKSQKAYLAKITSNYAGNGTYSTQCGEMIKTKIELEPTPEPAPVSESK